MDTADKLQLHFDLLSHRALLSCGSRDYVLPDQYPDRDAARRAAQEFAWETLGYKGRNRQLVDCSQLPVWLR
ncbi:hypothetical protein LPJGGPFB_05120 [Ensifer adhaerens]|uniref:hypothetical protein n=1 Tax=Ensifer adhaerens TaxID=106592 RepID=UPI0015695D6E|nr:hypothetical protein [Ensifer adhaerens]NRP21861.1 hypothetical protein [Ensifer adhaerens]